MGNHHLGPYSSACGEGVGVEVERREPDVVPGCILGLGFRV